MKKPHKHAKFIKAWADGAEIEYRTSSSAWNPIISGWSWDSPLVFGYRIKPEPKPDIVETYWVETASSIWDVVRKHNLKLVFNGETGKLKAAEVI